MTQTDDRAEFEAEMPKLPQEQELNGLPRSYGYTRDQLVEYGWWVWQAARAQQAEATTDPATHMCIECGAYWRQSYDGWWNLRSDTCGKCCDNEPMEDQIVALASSWKERALKAEAAWAENEAACNRLVAELNSINGPTQMGEPVLPEKARAQQAEAEPVTQATKTAPETIWLQVGNESFSEDHVFPSDHESVSWCDETVFNSDVKYTRSDLCAPPTPAPVVPEPLPVDDARLALWKAVSAIEAGNWYDEKLILEKLRKAGLWICKLQAAPQPENKEGES